MTWLFKNNVTSELAASITAADTTVQILDPSSFPTSVPPGVTFLVTLEQRQAGGIEICVCPAIAGDVLTIVRAQEGTTALPFTAFDLIQSRLTAAQLKDFQDDIDNLYATKADTTYVDDQDEALKLYVDAADAALQLGLDGKTEEAPNNASAYRRQGEAWVADPIQTDAASDGG